MLGAAIVADNGAASDKNTCRMRSCGFSYLTRVNINASDLKNIEEHCHEFEYIGGGMMCYTHRFASSGRRRTCSCPATSWRRDAIRAGTGWRRI